MFNICQIILEFAVGDKQNCKIYFKIGSNLFACEGQQADRGLGSSIVNPNTIW